MKHLMFLVIILLLILTTVSTGAQLSGTVSGPVVGFTFDSNRGALRPIRGIAGSATVGPPVDLGFQLSQVVALDQFHMVVSSVASPHLRLVDLAGSSPAITAIEGVPANPRLATASVQGKSAAFYDSNLGQIVIVSDLPQSPKVSRPEALSRLPGGLTHMAVSDDGSLVVYGIENKSGAALYRWTSNSQSSDFLVAPISIGGLAIASDRSVVVADRGGNEIFALRDGEGEGGKQPIAGVPVGVSDPVGVAIVGGRIFVANAGTSTVMEFDSFGRLVRKHPCDCRISGVHPFGDSIFRLTDRADQVLYLMDTAGDRIVFVPPPRD